MEENRSTMIKNHFKSALRNIWGNKIFAFSNIFGLAISIACSLLIFLFVKDEISYDRFNKDANHTYRVVQDFINDDGTTVPDATTPPALAPAMQRQIPDVLCATRLFVNPDGGQTFLFKYEDKNSMNRKVLRQGTDTASCSYDCVSISKARSWSFSIQSKFVVS